MNATTKPTVRTNDVAAMRAIAEHQNYHVTATNTGWTVRNLVNGEEYHVLVSGECDCPHATGRLRGTGRVCKHFALCDLTERLGALRSAPAPLSAPAPRRSAAERSARIYRDFGPDC